MFIINIFITLIIILQSSVFANEIVEIPLELQNFITNLEQTKHTIQGGAIAILQDGIVIYKTTFGKQNGDVGTITNKTLFPLASVSKPISAMAIALLVEQNKISLDEVFKLPYLEHNVSLANILSHTTGYKFSGNLEIEQGMSKEQILGVLQNQQPNCNVGQCYKYSNYMFSLIEEILNQKNLSLKIAFENLRRALKTQDIQILPFEHAVEIAYPHTEKRDKKKPGNKRRRTKSTKINTINRNYIANSVGIDAISRDAKPIMARRAKIDNLTFVKLFNFNPMPFPPYYPSAAPAAAGVFASIDGMIEIFKLSFGYMPNLISQKTLDRIHTPVIKATDILKWHIKWPVNKNTIESYYALGWRILNIKDTIGKDLIFHGGHIKGINNFIGFIPSKKIGIIILVNQDSDFPINSGLALWSLLVNPN